MATVCKKTPLTKAEKKNTGKSRSGQTYTVEYAALAGPYAFSRQAALMRESNESARRSLLKAIIRSYLE